MTENKISYAFGWVHEYPDFRDYSPQHEKIAPILTDLNMVKVAGTELPTKVDLDLMVFTGGGTERTWLLYCQCRCRHD